MVHIALHFLVPLLVAFLFFRSRWKIAFVIMLSSMLIDLDHLLATPVYDPQRCSVGFHPLHSLYILPLYVVLSLLPVSRLFGIGLVIHILLDAIDCRINTQVWFV